MNEQLSLIDTFKSGTVDLSHVVRITDVFMSESEKKMKTQFRVYFDCVILVDTSGLSRPYLQIDKDDVPENYKDIQAYREYFVNKWRAFKGVVSVEEKTPDTPVDGPISSLETA